MDSPHQEAHSGQPPYHHPPEGEFPGCLMGGREWLSPRASSGEPWGLTFGHWPHWTMGSVQRMLRSSVPALWGVLVLQGRGGNGS